MAAISGPSLGYEETIFDADEWAEYVARVGGSMYGVDGGSWKPSVGVGIRAVSIAAGTGWGWGVKDLSSSPVTLNHSSIGSGSRWDLIVAHRNWATSTTTFEIIEGTATKALPARDTTPGTEDDQPIALVLVVPGSVVSTIVDLRIWTGEGGAFALDPLVLSFANRVGTQIKIGSSLWSRDIDGLGSGSWVDLLADPTWTNITHVTGAVNGSGVHTFGYARIPAGVALKGYVQKSSGTWAVGVGVASLPPAARPASTVRYDVPASTGIARLRFQPDGIVRLDSMITGAAPDWLSFDGITIPR